MRVCVNVRVCVSVTHVRAQLSHPCEYLDACVFVSIIRVWGYVCVCVCVFVFYLRYGKGKA